MITSKIGDIALQCRKNIPNHYQKIIINEFVVMPNHIHGIITINPSVGTQYLASDNNQINDNKGTYNNTSLPGIQPKSGSLGAIIR
jgi:putative transposase